MATASGSRSANSEITLYGAALALAVLIILLGGGITLHSQAVALLGTGALLLWKPPAGATHRWICAGLGGMLILASASMILPRLGGAGPVFYALGEVFGVSVPGTLSVQPFATLEGILLMLVGCSWIFLLWSRPLYTADRKVLARATVLVSTLLALGILVGNGLGAKWFFATESTVFTFIPNRNQMGNVLMLSAFLAVATSMDGIRRRGQWPILGFTCATILLFAMIQLHSRAVIVLFFVGILLWFLFKGMGREQARFIKAGVPLTLLFFSVFLYFGEDSRDRILNQLQDANDGKMEYRLLLYEDSLTMWAARPLTGFGLGNFQAVFPHFREASFHSERVLHPDSDLFWLLTEMGILGVGMAGLALAGTLRLLRFGRFRHVESTRLMAWICLILFLLHSLVDVSGHRLGTFAFLVLILTLGCGRRRPDLALPPYWAPGWRLLGAFLFLTGLLWWLGPRVGYAATLAHQPTLLQSALEQATGAGEPEVFRRAAARYQRAYPVYWEPYFARASGSLQLEGESRQAVQDFRIARHLNPTSPRMTFLEGEAWLPVNPSRALDAWRETLRRPRDSSRDHRQRIAGYFREYPELRPGLLALSETDSGLRFLLLSQIGGGSFRRELERDLSHDELLSFYTEHQRQRLLVRYAQQGGGQRLLDLMERSPDIASPAWELRAMALANTGRLHEAIQTFREALPRPEIPVRDDMVGTRQLEREFASQPHDLLKGTILLQRQIEERNWSGALQTARTISRNPEAPSYVFYWSGEIHFMQDELENSWAAFLQYLRRR